jgi:hypothetical protein
MLRLSKKADYALIAMKHLAVRADAGSASAREIAEHYDIPIELMAKVLQRLARRNPRARVGARERRLDFVPGADQRHVAVPDAQIAHADLDLRIRRRAVRIDQRKGGGEVPSAR